jgi:hypothetical protein
MVIGERFRLPVQKETVNTLQMAAHHRRIQTGESEGRKRVWRGGQGLDSARWAGRRGGSRRSEQCEPWYHGTPSAHHGTRFAAALTTPPA